MCKSSVKGKSSDQKCLKVRHLLRDFCSMKLMTGTCQTGPRRNPTKESKIQASSGSLAVSWTSFKFLGILYVSADFETDLVSFQIIPVVWLDHSSSDMWENHLHIWFSKLPVLQYVTELYRQAPALANQFLTIESRYGFQCRQRIFISFHKQQRHRIVRQFQCLLLLPNSRFSFYV